MTEEEDIIILDTPEDNSGIVEVAPPPVEPAATETELLPSKHAVYRDSYCIRLNGNSLCSLDSDIHTPYGQEPARGAVEAVELGGQQFHMLPETLPRWKKFISKWHPFVREDAQIIYVSSGTVAQYQVRAAHIELNADGDPARYNDFPDQDWLCRLAVSKQRKVQKPLRRRLVEIQRDLGAMTERHEAALDVMHKMPVHLDRRDEHHILKTFVESSYLRYQDTRQEYEHLLEDAKKDLRDAIVIPGSRKKVAEYLQRINTREAMARFCQSIEVLRETVTISYRNNLLVEGIDYGRPILTLRFEGSFPIKVAAESDKYQEFMHPHIGGGGFCLGTFAPPLGRAFLSMDLPSLAELGWRYLSTYNDRSPLNSITDCKARMLMSEKKPVYFRRRNGDGSPIV